MASVFITQLNKDILKQSRIYQNANIFIFSKKLKKYNSIIKSEKNLPIQVFLGSFFLIKNNSILEGYSHMAPTGYINFFTKYRRANPKLHFTNKIIIRNISAIDVIEFNNPDIFLSKEDITTHNKDRLCQFILAMLRAGFILYLLQSS